MQVQHTVQQPTRKLHIEGKGLFTEGITKVSAGMHPIRASPHYDNDKTAVFKMGQFARAGDHLLKLPIHHDAERFKTHAFADPRTHFQHCRAAKGHINQ